MSFSLHTHEFVSRSGQSVLDRINPYIRLAEGHGPAIFAQAGVFWYENGTAIEEAKLPEWFTKQWALVAAEAKEDAGFDAAPKKLAKDPGRREPS